mmetsp:Transcript_52545/g.79746  ORF Transcript_52545/g.79746 Transcript_52545/m.79746 type:complete len:117 (-) Transcript_52545:485-835(-)
MMWLFVLERRARKSANPERCSNWFSPKALFSFHILWFDAQDIPVVMRNVERAVVKLCCGPRQASNRRLQGRSRGSLPSSIFVIVQGYAISLSRLPIGIGILIKWVKKFVGGPALNQ